MLRAILGTFEMRKMMTMEKRTSACRLSSFSCCWCAAVALGPITRRRRFSAPYICRTCSQV